MVWFDENLDLWENVGDHIEFLCPIEQVPSEVQQAAESYRRTIVKWEEKMKIYNSMNLRNNE